ncbi:MAG: hypothetical protein LKKZDAJK_000753 [Candidatus Fervidibacter sp.]
MDGSVQALLIDIANGNDSDVFALLLKALDGSDVGIALTATADDADTDTTIGADDLWSARKGVGTTGLPLSGESTKSR